MWSCDKVVGILLLLVAACSPIFAERPTENLSPCVSFTEAKSHIGSKQCISGKVLGIEHTEGMTFLNFCEDFRVCPFTVVIFEEDMRHVGAVSSLVGRTIEIRGKIKD